MHPRSVASIWLFANVAGAFLFLYVASMFWIEPELADIPGASGGAGIAWFFFVAPIILVAVILNLGALIWAYVVRHKEGNWPMANFSWFIVLVWLAVLWLDNSRHGI